MPFFTKTEEACVKEQGIVETSEADAYSLQINAELWRAVIQEGSPPAEDTRAALQAIRAALDAARRLRFAGSVSEDERCRLAVLADEAVAQQDCALRHWYMGRSLDAPAVPAVPEAVATSSPDARFLSPGLIGLVRRKHAGKIV